ncbi:MAG: hypothetical protein ACRDBM_06040 [Sporomusa sp.]
MLPVIAATIAWGILVILAIINGGIREEFMSVHVGEQVGHIISSIILYSVVLLVAYIFVNRVGIEYKPNAMLATGLYWFILTIGFEFIFGHYVAGHSWERLLADYNILNGRIWILVLITVLCAPRLCYHFIR